MERAFADGLRRFKVPSQYIRIQHVTGHLSDFSNDADGGPAKPTTFVRRRTSDIVDKAAKILQRIDMFNNPENLEVLLSFSTYVDAAIKGITITGNIAPQFHGGPTTNTLLISAFSDRTISLESLSEMSRFTSITGIRILTKQIRTEEDMKKVGMAVSSLYKVLQIFGKPLLPLFDQPSSEEGAIVQILFDGMYDMKYIVAHPISEGTSSGSSRAVPKNVYMFGQNGAGKSTWGNLIAGGSTKYAFVCGDGIHTTLLPQHCDIGPDERFRLWDLPGLYDGSSYASVIQDHISDTIKSNCRYVCVIFILHGLRPPDNNTNNILKYSLSIFGPSVRTSFLAIVNNFYGNSQKTSPYANAYAHVLDFNGFEITEKSFFVLGTEEDAEKYQEIRKILTELPVHLVLE